MFSLLTLGYGSMAARGGKAFAKSGAIKSLGSKPTKTTDFGRRMATTRISPATSSPSETKSQLAKTLGADNSVKPETWDTLGKRYGTPVSQQTIGSGLRRETPYPFPTVENKPSTLVAKPTRRSWKSEQSDYFKRMDARDQLAKLSLGSETTPALRQKSSTVAKTRVGKVQPQSKPPKGSAGASKRQSDTRTPFQKWNDETYNSGFTHSANKAKESRWQGIRFLHGGSDASQCGGSMSQIADVTTNQSLASQQYKYDTETLKKYYEHLDDKDKADFQRQLQAMEKQGLITSKQMEEQFGFASQLSEQESEAAKELSAQEAQQESGLMGQEATLQREHELNQLKDRGLITSQTAALPGANALAPPEEVTPSNPLPEPRSKIAPIGKPSPLIGSPFAQIPQQQSPVISSGISTPRQ